MQGAIILNTEVRYSIRYSRHSCIVFLADNSTVFDYTA